MLRRVPGRPQRLKGKAAKIDLRAIGEPLIRGRELRCSRRQDGCTLSGELAATRDEVGMQMGLEGEGNPQSEPSCQIEIGLWIAARIDHEGAPVPQRNEIG